MKGLHGKQEGINALKHKRKALLPQGRTMVNLSAEFNLRKHTVYHKEAL